MRGAHTIKADFGNQLADAHEPGSHVGRQGV